MSSAEIDYVTVIVMRANQQKTIHAIIHHRTSLRMYTIYRGQVRAVFLAGTVPCMYLFGLMYR